MPVAHLHLRFPVQFGAGAPVPATAEVGSVHAARLNEDALRAVAGKDPEWTPIDQSLGARSADTPPEVMFVVLRGTFRNQGSAKMSARRMWDKRSERDARAGAILMWGGTDPEGADGERHIFFSNGPDE